MRISKIQYPCIHYLLLVLDHLFIGNYSFSGSTQDLLALYYHFYLLDHIFNEQ